MRNGGCRFWSWPASNFRPSAVSASVFVKFVVNYNTITSLVEARTRMFSCFVLHACTLLAFPIDFQYKSVRSIVDWNRQPRYNVIFHCSIELRKLLLLCIWKHCYIYDTRVLITSLWSNYVHAVHSNNFTSHRFAEIDHPFFIERK